MDKYFFKIHYQGRSGIIVLYSTESSIVEADSTIHIIVISLRLQSTCKLHRESSTSDISLVKWVIHFKPRSEICIPLIRSKFNGGLFSSGCRLQKICGLASLTRRTKFNYTKSKHVWNVFKWSEGETQEWSREFREKEKINIKLAQRKPILP